MFRSGASKEQPFRSQPTHFSFFKAPENRVKETKENPRAAVAALADPSSSRLERGI
jgi:hypothetical protein